MAAPQHPGCRLCVERVVSVLLPCPRTCEVALRSGSTFFPIFPTGAPGAGLMCARRRNDSFEACELPRRVRGQLARACSIVPRLHEASRDSILAAGVLPRRGGSADRVLIVRTADRDAYDRGPLRSHEAEDPVIHDATGTAYLFANFAAITSTWTRVIVDNGRLPKAVFRGRDLCFDKLRDHSGRASHSYYSSVTVRSTLRAHPTVTIVISLSDV